MKTKIFSALLIMGTLFAGTSCTEDMEYKDVEVTAVKQLFSPKDNQSVQLLSSATASVFFEWSTALAKDGNAPLYEVVFDKVGGDFTHPVYRVVSDDMGSRPYATITHKVLDRIAALAGLGSGETGQVIWTVVSSRGINQKVGEEVRTLTITRLLGFSEIPAEVFLTGEGSETGTDTESAYALASPESGEFEIFTRLEANKPYYFISSKVGAPRVFFAEDGKLKESSTGDQSATVSETGVYRLQLDFNVATFSMTKVESLGWFFSPSNAVEIPMTYEGHGIWTGSGVTNFKEESWVRDERYKFEMVYDKDGTRSVVHWGPTNASLDSRPSDNEGEAYFYMKEWPTSQWDNKWKLHERFDGQMTKFTFYLNGDGPYRHTVELAQ